jgi:hypothetical protein
VDKSWVHVDACTLPTVERPVRAAEFDSLFAERLVRVEATSPTEAVFLLQGGAEVRGSVEDLTARESACCSFFRFDLHEQGADLALVVGVPAAYADVLEALTNRAESAIGAQDGARR